jgi:predicted exporter
VSAGPGAPPTTRRRWLVLGAWLVALAAASVVAFQAKVVADLSAFLPSAPTAEQAVLLEQLKSGASTRLLLIAIEGGSATDRAEASRQLAAALRDGIGKGRFASVENGDTAAWAAGGQVLFDHRYVLSPAVDAARFEVDGLRAAFEETVSLLGTPAGTLVKPILFRDPTGETIRLAEALTPADAPRSEQGVWVSRRAPRAVLVATTRADGSDLDGQAAAIASVHAAFAAQRTQGLTVDVTGPGSFGVASRARIEAESERLALWGAVAMALLLLVAFASLKALAVGALPVASGVVAGIAAVSLGFGSVHGMTLGFGTTLIAEAVDYAIYYLLQSRTASTEARGSGAARWLATQWPTMRLGLLTSLAGFVALVFSGFPGLAQLGVFSVAGLLAAAATTRFVLPVLAPDGAPGRGLRRQLGTVAARMSAWLPTVQKPLAVLVAVALVAIVFLPSPWRGTLLTLSPLAADELARDRELRDDVGAADGGTLIAVQAASEGAALAAAEAVGRRLDPLVAAGTLAGYTSPARLLPSPETQAARRAALPAAAALRPRVAAAAEGGVLDASRLEPFIADVEAARTRAPLDRATLAGTPLAMALDALLVPGDATRPWRAIVNVQPASGPAATATLTPAAAESRDANAPTALVATLRSALADVPGARVVAIAPELDRLYDRYVGRAMWQAGLGALAVVALLAWQLRDARRLLRVVWPLVAAPALVLAALTASGEALGILHLVGFLLTVAIGSNYALFYDSLHRGGATPMTDADRTDTLASLLLANAAIVLSFGLLAGSSIPVLAAIGTVVAPGTLLCLLLSAAFVPPGRDGRIPRP